MDFVRQGDLLFLEKNSMHVLVLSRDFFNKSGFPVVCPVKKEAFEDALHIAVETPVFKGTALLEHIKSIDLQTRFYKKIAEIPFEQIQDISDAVQGIFEYYPFSVTVI